MGDRWGIYARISYVKRRTVDGKTVVDTLGVDRQEPPSRGLVERMGGEVREVYVDNDISAYSGKRRPNYERMLADVQAGAIDGIVAWHPDRLTRQPTENERLIALTETYGTKLQTVQAGEHDLATPAGRLSFRLLGNIARYESEHKAARLMLKHDQKAAAGEPHASPRPFGFERGGLVVRESEAKIIREAVERLLAKEPMGAVVRDFRDRKVTGTGGKLLTTTSLRNILCNPRVAGIRVHRGAEVGKGAWRAIIPEGDFRRVRGIFTGRTRQAKGTKPGRGRTYAYSGLLVCWACKGRLAGSSGSYRCQACRRTYIQAAPLEQIMDEAFLQRASSEAFAERLARRLEALQAGDTTAEELERDRAELADYQALPGRFHTDQTRVRTAELESRVANAARRLAAVPELGALMGLPRSEIELRKAWAAWTAEQRHAKLAAVLERIDVASATRRHSFDPDRLDPHWRF